MQNLHVSESAVFRERVIIYFVRVRHDFHVCNVLFGENLFIAYIIPRSFSRCSVFDFLKQTYIFL